MAILSSAELKPKFRNGLLPSQNDFYDLIDSCLNKREDCFFGKWKSGTEYCHGNVVIYDKTLYILLLSPEDMDCEEPADSSSAALVNRKASPPPAGPNPNSLCICSTVIPPCDERWCKLELHVEDEDWEIPTDEPDVMYAKVYGKIGMGTSAPCARVDITDDYGGHHLFAASGTAAMNFVMEKPSDATHWPFVRQSVDEECNTWLTTWPLGYAFKKIKEECASPTGENGKWATTSIASNDQLTLLFITTDVHDQPAVGIGTGKESPRAALDVYYEGRGHIQLHPTYSDQAEIIVVNPHHQYLAMGLSQGQHVEDALAEFNTNAKAYCFNFEKNGYDYLGHNTPSLSNVLTITKEGNVGICNKDPDSKLVIDGEAGSFCMESSLALINPAFSMINLMPRNRDQAANYLTIGPSDTHAVFLTNAKKGFVFKRGEECGVDNHEKDITHGANLVEVSPEGKVGIRISPDEYLLDVAGPVASYESYQRAPEGPNLDRCDAMEDVLDDLCKVKTWRYSWKRNTVACDNGDDKFGIDADDLYHCLPELVRSSNNERCINYSGMVSALVHAIKELKHELNSCQDRIKALERGRY